MNVIYSCCAVDPFLKVAKALERERRIAPVYWIGDIASVDADSVDEEMTRKVYPTMPFQRYFDAWRGVFPEEIEKKAAETYFDIDFIRQFSSEELQALSMMDRLDYDRHSFIYMERERYYISLVKKWLACFDIYKPDMVISAVNPHRVFDYVLYLVCKYKGVRFVSFQWSIEAGRIYPLEDFSNKDALKRLLDSDYQMNLKKETSDFDLPDDINRNYKRMSVDYSTARPKYMAAHDVDDKNNQSLFFLMRRFMTSHKIFGKQSMFIVGQTRTIYKNRDYSLEHSKFSVWEWYKKRRETFKYNKYLHDYYCNHTSDVALDVPYIAFFLHYQPEETTSPNGDIFANQFLCIETLLKNTPESVFIYVKEHPNQFMSHMQGHTKRIKEYYDDLISNPRVKLVPFEKDSFSLMTNALAVSTVTGTVGWEAAVRKKPVIIFGLIWYERMKGVLRVTDDETASKINDFIKSYKYDEHAILAYLYTFANHSILAYHYKGYKEICGYSEETTVTNICNSLIQLLN
ncbi:hypothetical protein [Bacteroides heparinolyticus]|uniref:capsular polysaccharide export protein, LipB/KpsS family n=1 Tax=Prevotella heparinolytica TaxID=28113 RepID=UPI0023F1B017|nr:hypothetical protein [Bacteroides heparinolyticus]